MAVSHHNPKKNVAPWFTKDGLIARLVALHSDGTGFNDIRTILQDEFDLPQLTKNQVIGKARRLTLPRRKPVEVRPKLPRHRLDEAQSPKPRKRRPAPLPRLSDGRPGSPRPSIPLPPPTSSLPPLLPALALPRDAWRVENLPIVTLRGGECKFAYGEAPYQFCGRPQVEGYVYCAHHLPVVYRPRGAADEY